MVERNAPSPLKLRTVFISDIHLGFKGCSAELLLDFLHYVEMEYLFLVGDIIDVWSMKKSMFWPQAHNNVVRTILGKAKRGTKVIFVPGNHDEVFREFDGAVFGNLEIHREYVHVGADGRRMLDPARRRVRQRGQVQPLARQARQQYLRRPAGRSTRISTGAPAVRLAALVAVRLPQEQDQEGAASTSAASRNPSRKPRASAASIRWCAATFTARRCATSSGILYCNDGDWVESCSSLVEDMNGQLRLIDWPKLKEQLPALPLAIPVGHAA